MLIDDTQSEETRVVIINGNKIEDVEFESASRKQIKGNIYLAKVMRVEPSLQAAFVDYGGNRHGFLAFGEIHPDYYNISPEVLAEIDKDVETIIENKKQNIKEREVERERIREERAQKRVQLEEERLKTAVDAPVIASNQVEENTASVEVAENGEAIEVSSDGASENATEESLETTTEATEPRNNRNKNRRRFRRKRYNAPGEEVKTLAASSDNGEVIQGDAGSEYDDEKTTINNSADDDFCNASDDDDDADAELDFEMQKKLLKVRKLFHRSAIQDVIKEGQILVVQVVKEERGNKGAALTTYLSLAGRYCVLMPNRIKSGGVSRKITNISDRRRLKTIVKELPLTSDMSMIVRTAGEEKTKSDIVKDYNYLIRTWNNIRIAALKSKAPALIHEEGNLIKRALRDMFTKDITEVIVDGESSYHSARDFIKILAPQNLKKLKSNQKNENPLFQRFQIEAQLDKLHDTNVQLESGGYLVINPTEALVSIDVNSGRATKEKDLEETALKTNLEAADEIARQLRMRNLAGLVVVDFIDMEEPKNNQAIERRMKEAMKDDRARVQIAKMSCFGLLEISRQRMHSSFMESNYKTCPCCKGKGMIRTIESSCTLILRNIEEEGIKNRSSTLNISVPKEVAIYILNQKRQALADLEKRYSMIIIISADSSIKNIDDFKIERTKMLKPTAPLKEEKEPEVREVLAEKTPEIIVKDEVVATTIVENAENGDNLSTEEKSGEKFQQRNNNNNKRDRRNRFDRRDRRNRGPNNNYGNNRENSEHGTLENNHVRKEKAETVILYNSHEDRGTYNNNDADDKEGKKSTWWRKLIS